MSQLEPEPPTLAPAGAGRRALERLPRPHVAAFAVEVAVVAAGALIYFLVRGAVVDRAAEAVARAQGLMEIERALGLFWEPALHEWALSSRFLTELMNGFYFWLHMPLIVVAAVTLFWRRRPLYVFTRNAFLVSALAALAMYYALPLAPPRFFPELGFVDTLALYGGGYQAEEAGPFVNSYAALPSLHFGWALLIGLAVWRARPRGRAGAALAGGVALLLPSLQFFAVVMTANHFVLDVAAGAALAAVGAAVAFWWQGRDRPSWGGRP